MDEHPQRMSATYVLTQIGVAVAVAVPYLVLFAWVVWGGVR
jgi:hypothetical protein